MKDKKIEKTKKLEYFNLFNGIIMILIAWIAHYNSMFNFVYVIVAAGSIIYRFNHFDGVYITLSIEERKGFIGEFGWILLSVSVLLFFNNLDVFK